MFSGFLTAADVSGSALCGDFGFRPVAPPFTGHNTKDPIRAFGPIFRSGGNQWAIRIEWPGSGLNLQAGDFRFDRPCGIPSDHCPETELSGIRPVSGTGSSGRSPTRNGSDPGPESGLRDRAAGLACGALAHATPNPRSDTVTNTASVGRLQGWALVAASALLPSAAAAQQAADPGLLGLLQALDMATRPSMNVTMQGIGSGTVAPGGTLFGSISGSNKRGPDSDDVDGSLSFGAGFGNAATGIGLQASVNVTSVEDRDFGDSGFLSLKFGHSFDRTLHAAIGFDNVVTWGDASDNSVETTVALTRFGHLGGSGGTPYMLTLGAGSHARDDDPGLIAGFGLGLTEYLGASISYSGDYANLGVGVKIPGLKGASVSLTCNDIFDEEDSRRATLSLSFTLRNAFGMGG